MSKHETPVGVKYGRWTVISRSQVPVKPVHWLCECECGTQKNVHSGNLKRGLSQSCGCLKIEQSRKRATVHGEKTTTYASREYIAWTSMKRRCFNKNTSDYQRYGGRGITVCARWSSYANFLSDMGRCPDGFSLDRVDNDKSYSPTNCRWASRKTQSQNRRCVKKYTYGGIELSLADWAKQKGIKLSTMINRVAYAGWSIQKAIETPVRGSAKQQ